MPDNGTDPQKRRVRAMDWHNASPVAHGSGTATPAPEPSPTIEQINEQAAEKIRAMAAESARPRFRSLNYNG